MPGLLPLTLVVRIPEHQSANKLNSSEGCLWDSREAHFVHLVPYKYFDDTLSAIRVKLPEPPQQFIKC
jgi:hypothetical protein